MDLRISFPGAIQDITKPTIKDDNHKNNVKTIFHVA